jgi:hypothetical protein
MNGRLVRIATVLGLSVLGLASSGCSPSSCSRGEDATTVEASPDHITDGVYYSAPYGGPYQDYPGGRTIHFMHGLGKGAVATSVLAIVRGGGHSNEQSVPRRGYRQRG